MITVAMSTAIRARRRRVWRALVEPGAVARWTPYVVAPADTPEGYPRSGQHVRWRCRLGRVPLTLHDRPLEVVSEHLLRRSHDLGPLHLVETFRLDDSTEDDGLTRLHLKLVAPNRVPLVGGLMDRFAVRRFATALAGDSLRQIRDLCEREPGE